MSSVTHHSWVSVFRIQLLTVCVGGELVDSETRIRRDKQRAIQVQYGRLVQSIVTLDYSGQLESTLKWITWERVCVVCLGGSERLAQIVPTMCHSQ